MKDDRFLIITGLSGSGKTCVSRFLEDQGYYCIDNLPAKMIPILVDLWKRKEVEIGKTALVVDVRESGFSRKLPDVLDEIPGGSRPKLIFLEAADKTLIKRFSESRRPHPLSRSGSVVEGIALERENLAEIRNMADEVIDTSEMTVVQLREMLMLRFSPKKQRIMQVLVLSFGYKYGIPLDSDLVFDSRFLSNPYYVDRLRDKTGKTKPVRDYVMAAEDTSLYLESLTGFLEFVLPRFVKEGKSYLTIAIGCTGGKHRSVVLADEIGKYLRQKKYKSRIYHRDMYK